MAKLPFEFFDSIANTATSMASNLTGKLPPAQSGAMSRQAQVPPRIDGRTTRQVMRWLVPEQPIVEMYINPQQVSYKYKKLTTKTRVKGGYSLQYWGEDLIGISVNGTTGTSGIEGINVLLDVYRNEQVMFDPYALLLQAERDKKNQESFDNTIFGGSGPFGIGSIPFLGAVPFVADQIDSSLTSNAINARNKPTLASLAFTVEMYWMGEVFRGFFEDFDYKDSVDRLGLFDYNFTFSATQRRGFRNNFMPWHHHPSYGQSNWREGGPPLSYGVLTDGLPASSPPLQGSNQSRLDMLTSFDTIDAFMI